MGVSGQRNKKNIKATRGKKVISADKDVYKFVFGYETEEDIRVIRNIYPQCADLLPLVFWAWRFFTLDKCWVDSGVIFLFLCEWKGAWL